MKPAALVKSVRNIRNVVATNINRSLGREFIPRHPGVLHIETSSTCNLDCVFCAYTKKVGPRVSMSDTFFRDCVEQGVELGYHRVDLTPCTGDVFMDHHIFQKMEFLDRHPGIRGYGFHSNFTVPRLKDIERLLGLEKFDALSISVYGCDLPTFLAVTKSTENVYHRLVHNLETLYGALDRKRFHLKFAMHPARRGLRSHKSELLDVMDRFRKAGIYVFVSKGIYNNWGGYITQDDVGDLPIEVTSNEAIYKNGACVRLFTTFQITSTGIVNGCACRDVATTLRIGDMNKNSLREILSPQNAQYMALIAQQQAGNFPEVCKNCDFYSSIHHKSSSYRKNAVELQTIEEFKADLANLGRRADDERCADCCTAQRQAAE